MPPNSLQEKFEQMGNKNLTVMIDAEIAKKIKDFFTIHLPNILWSPSLIVTIATQHEFLVHQYLKLLTRFY